MMHISSRLRPPSVEKRGHSQTKMFLNPKPKDRAPRATHRSIAFSALVLTFGFKDIAQLTRIIPASNKNNEDMMHISSRLRPPSVEKRGHSQTKMFLNPKVKDRATRATQKCCF